MNEIDFETQLHALAQRMEYPRTPDIAGRVMTRLQFAMKPRFIPRRLAWLLIIGFILLSSLFLIPPARAAILEFIQIGIVRIFPRAETPTVETPRTATSILEAPRTATPEANTPASSDLIPILNQIAGKTTLAEAQKLVTYPILLPSYPSDLGDPNLVYVQNAGGYMTILIWLVPGQPDKASMSLHFIPNDSWVIKKFEPKVIQERSVNGQRAVWTEGPYPLILRNSNVEFTRLVNGHVLIWTDGDITYRLETDLPLDEAVKIAESLQSIP